MSNDFNSGIKIEHVSFGSPECNYRMFDLSKDLDPLDSVLSDPYSDFEIHIKQRKRKKGIRRNNVLNIIFNFFMNSFQDYYTFLLDIIYSNKCADTMQRQRLEKLMKRNSKYFFMSP